MKKLFTIVILLVSVSCFSYSVFKGSTKDFPAELRGAWLFEMSSTNKGELYIDHKKENLVTVIKTKILNEVNEEMETDRIEEYSFDGVKCFKIVFKQKGHSWKIMMIDRKRMEVYIFHGKVEKLRAFVTIKRIK